MGSVGSGHARIEREHRRADVIIDRPDSRNAMNAAVIDDLTAAFERVDEDEDVRAVTLTGEGAVLSAGMDLEMMRTKAERGNTVTEAFPRLLDAIESCRHPTVVGIKRAAPAGAFELTLPFDFRLVGADASYGVLEVRLGTFPHGGATQRLPRLVGLSAAKRYVLTGEFVDPEVALRDGLVHEVCEPGTVDERTRAFADRLARNAPLGMRRAKRALNAAPEMALDEGLELERALAEPLDDTHDYREGFAARIEGREPEFEGR